MGIKGTNTVSGYPLRYTYDRVGNRIGQTEGTQQRTLTYNQNNQLVQLERPKSARVRGYVNEYTTNVAVRSNTATNWVPAVTRFTSYTQTFFDATATITNSGTNNSIFVRAVDGSNNASTSRVQVSNAYIPNQPAIYDGDGNQLTALGITNSYDAENRLVRIGYSSGRTELRYDGSDRLREVTEYNAAGTQTSLVRYVWNGWLPWAELNSTNGVVRTFTWGVDLSGTVGGAGGIGGLLAIRQGTTNYYCRSDGKGNVTDLRQSNGTFAASYTYAPFGALLTQSNTYGQPFRFQSKLFHARSGLVYFGARWYSPSAGTWLTREPLGEGASINLYA